MLFISYVNEKDFYKFEEVPIYDKDDLTKPYELKHVFDLNKEDYVVNENHCCYWVSVYDISNIKLKSNDDSIVSIDGEYIIMNHKGKCILTLSYPENPDVKEINFSIFVYSHNLPKLDKVNNNIIFLRENSMIKIDNFLRHCHCTHLSNCLFQSNLFKTIRSELEDKIWLKEKTIESYENILNSYLNRDIIYNSNLDELYDIRITHKEGNTIVNVGVVDDFPNKVRSKLNKERFELRELKRLRNY